MTSTVKSIIYGSRLNPLIDYFVTRDIKKQSIAFHYLNGQLANESTNLSIGFSTSFFDRIVLTDRIR